MIKDASDQEMFKATMRGKSFSLYPFEEEHVVFSAKESVAEVCHRDSDTITMKGWLKLKKWKQLRTCMF